MTYNDEHLREIRAPNPDYRIYNHDHNSGKD